MRWRPIKTAPKDKLILLAEPPNPARSHWLVGQGRWIDLPYTSQVMKMLDAGKPLPQATGSWKICYPGIMQVSWGLAEHKSYQPQDMIVWPTHWMPLPLAPKVKIQ